jgi:hypothetical protein
MQNPTISPNDTTNQVYGFLCQKTNVFYAFESYETYQYFLEWLERENANNESESNPSEGSALPGDLSED